MSRRRAPRPVERALATTVAELAPATTLARVQACWDEVAGPVVSAEAEPVSERGGVLTVACRSAVWAQELELLSADLVERLNAAIGAGGEHPPLRSLRLRAGAGRAAV